MAFSNTSDVSSPLTDEEQLNLASVSSVLPFWNTGNIDGVLDFYAERIVWTNVSMEEVYSGRSEVGGYLQQLLTAFPDLRFEVSHKIPRDHRVAERWVIRGTHLGPYMGIPPTGRDVDIHGMSIVHLRDGKFLSDRFYFDSSSVLRGLGLMPSPAVFRSPIGKGILAAASRISGLITSGSSGDAEEIAPVNDDSAHSPAEIESLRVLEEAVNAFNNGQLDAVADRFSSDVEIDNKTLIGLERGRPAATHSLTALARAFPDANLSIVQSLVRDDVIACEFRLRGSHVGPFLGIPPTSKPIDLPGISMITVRDGQIADVAIYSDSGMLWRQLGLMPPLSFLSTSAARVSLWLAVNRMRVAAVIVAFGIVTALRLMRSTKT
jgi:NTE family protein